MTGQWWILAALCCGLIIYGTVKAADWISRRETAEVANWQPALLIAGAMIVRLALAPIKGHGPDIGTFSAWAGHAAEGLFSFYSPGYFADYPPGYIYVLWLIGKLRIIFGIDFGSPAFFILLKLPAMLADIACVWLIFSFARKRWGPAAALASAALYAFNPAVILNSSVWGQVDGFFTLFIILGVLLLEERPAWSAVSFALALLIKPQALIFAPLPIFWFADRFLRRERNAAADFLIFSGAAVATFCLLALPFAVNQQAGWIISKYGDILASYPYATLNAFNFFALVGGNLAPAGERLLFVPYAFWGYAFIVLTVVFAAVAAFMGRDRIRFLFISLFLPVSTFVLSAKMHERYLFPALALALLLYAASRDRWLLVLFAGFSATQFLNAMDVLAFSYKNIYAVPRFDPLLLVVSLANVCLWIILVRIGYMRYIKRT